MKGMENEENYLEFVTSENYKHQIDIWYKAYNVSREKIELFHDFLSSLYNSINKTYLGPDVLFSEYDQRGHFTWCWNKVINDFEKERIFFQKTGKHYEYFWSFFLEAFYLTNIDGTYSESSNFQGFTCILDHYTNSPNNFKLFFKNKSNK